MLTNHVISGTVKDERIDNRRGKEYGLKLSFNCTVKYPRFASFNDSPSFQNRVKSFYLEGLAKYRETFTGPKWDTIEVDFWDSRGSGEDRNFPMWVVFTFEAGRPSEIRSVSSCDLDLRVLADILEEAYTQARKEYLQERLTKKYDNTTANFLQMVFNHIQKEALQEVDYEARLKALRQEVQDAADRRAEGAELLLDIRRNFSKAPEVVDHPHLLDRLVTEVPEYLNFRRIEFGFHFERDAQQNYREFKEKPVQIEGSAMEDEHLKGALALSQDS